MKTLKLPPLLLLLFLPVAMQAQFTFTTNNQALTITGYTGSDGNVVIPGMINGYPVTSVNTGFGLNNNMTNIIIPDSVTNLGGSSGGVAMFELCTNLRSATLSSNVTIIAEDMFDGCSSLASFTIGDNVTNIADCAFQQCTSLTNIIIGNAVTAISGSAFSACSRLATVNIPKSVTNLGTAPFMGCTNLTVITVDTNNPAFSSLGGVLFDKWQTKIIQYPNGKAGNYTVPNGVRSIGYMAFAYCTGLTNIIIPGSVTSIEDYSFVFSSLVRVCFNGTPPSLGGFSVFSGATNATIYYLPGMTWWGIHIMAGVRQRNGCFQTH
jgi:hypothetical protein